VHTNLKCIFVGGQGRTYVPKVLQDYPSLCARLFNSLDLLRGTNLLLYAINKTTLVSDSVNMANVYHSINSKNGTRRKRGGRRHWLKHKDWSYQPHHCVYRKISLQQISSHLLYPPLQHHFTNFHCQRTQVCRQDEELQQVMVHKWVQESRAQ